MNFRKVFYGVFIFVTLLFLVISCDHSEFNGFKETDSGLLYKIHHNNKQKKAQAGDYITVEMSYYTNEDSLLFDSKGQTFPLRIDEPVFPGDINEAMTYIGKGDSATFVIRADSFLIKNAKLPQLPSFVNQESKIIFHVKIHNIQTLEELEAEEKRKIQIAKDKEAQVILNYLEDNNITESPTESGLYFILNKKGSGSKPEPGDKVVVHYTGLFLDGTKFDSSYERNKPVEFKLGYGQVIQGWDIGVAKMHVGDEATFIIPSHLGYGSGRGEIPPFTPLLFKVKLININ